MLENIIQSHKEEFLGRRQETYIERDAKIRSSKSGLIQVILGPRRAGKSFFTIHSMEPGNAVGYINFDDERLSEIKNFDAIMEAVNIVYSSPKILLFDEIQNVENWELIVNRLQRQGYQLFITGSNSHLLSRELSTHLTGRHLKTTIFPFSFAEIIKHFGKSGDPIRQKCAEYISRGGFPELWMKQIDFPEYIRSLFDSVIFKDIVKRYKLRDSAALYNLSRYLISTICCEFSYQSLAKHLTFSSVVTVKKYVSHLEEAYLLFTIERFSFKVREQIRSNKKIYTYDNAFYQSASQPFSKDSGKILENTVAIELKRKEADNHSKIWYWKNEKHEEVDFIVQHHLTVEELIQVCYDPSDAKVKNREIRALIKAGKELNCNKLTVVTNNYESNEDVEWFGITGKIDFIPVHKFLLH